MKNSILQDLKFPFGNRLLDEVSDPQLRAAMNNVLVLARERIWLAEGKPACDDLLNDPGFSDEIDSYMLPTCERSVKLMERFVEVVDEETQG